VKIAGCVESGCAVQLSLGFDRALPAVWEYFRKEGLLMIGANEKTKKLLKYIRKGTKVVVTFPKTQGGSGVVGLGAVTTDVVNVFENNKFKKSDGELKRYRKFMQSVYADPANRPTKKYRPFNKQFKTHCLSKPTKAAGISEDSTTWDVGRSRWSSADAYENNWRQVGSTMEKVCVKWEATADFDKGFSSIAVPGATKKIALSPLLSICPRKFSADTLACIKSELKGVAQAPAERRRATSKRPHSNDTVAPPENEPLAKRSRTPSDMRALLETLGLLKYASVFAKEEIDMRALKLLSDSDLKSLGLPLGPRRKLQSSI